MVLMGDRMPCRWSNKQIVVLDQVVIDEPYRAADCRSNDENALKRVRQVVCVLVLERSGDGWMLTRGAARGREEEAGQQTENRHAGLGGAQRRVGSACAMPRDPDRGRGVEGQDVWEGEG